jgi:hypothetical protein
MSSVALSIKTDRSITDDFAGYWVQLPVVHAKNDNAALNHFLKSSAEKEQEVYEVVLHKLMTVGKLENYVERCVDPRFNIKVCRTTSSSFIPDDALQQKHVGCQVDTIKQPASNRFQSMLSKFGCFNPRVSE